MKNDLMLKIGVGGVVGFQALTFEYKDGEKLKPYVCKIVSHSLIDGYKKEFAQRIFPGFDKVFHHRACYAQAFLLERYEVYEYKRFMGSTEGEIEEGYFVILSDRIKELEPEEVRHWCGVAKEKELFYEQLELKLDIERKYPSNDIDF